MKTNTPRRSTTRRATALALIAVSSACAGQPTMPAAAATTAASDGATPATVARGRVLFLRCASCHANDDRVIAKIGPTLQGIVGRPVASVPGYGYSSALKSRTLVWDTATLDRWIEKPTQLAPETTMAFIGLPDAADRKALIAYLQTLK